ncbi:hypothetical protein AURDEDRAFT_111799 [Auricularia subglabra TFB-10046 SS5]|nr:hypothetical protein AURDEDRAFT_111799 [Auricularia subglabra TFB-10046 SS5]
MSSALDKSLDDMIVDKKRNRAPRRGRSTRGSTGTTGAVAGATARTRYSGILPSSNGNIAAKQAAAAAQVQSSAGAEKIIVSNLPPDVNEAQIKELFSTTVGPLKEVNLHFDQHGKSKGVAHVQFSRKGDGTKAYNQYNHRLIDGKRPMKIEIIVDPGKAPAPPLAGRLAPAPAAVTTGGGRRGKKGGEDNQLAGVAEAMEGVESNGGRGARGGRRGRGSRRGRGERPAKSAADLDAEMEEYTAAPAAAAAPPAVAAA